MRWLRPGLPPHQTPLAMIGAKPGQQVLMVGAGDGRLAAAVAEVTGLNGRTLVVDPSEEAGKRVEKAAADAGVLVDFEQHPIQNLPSSPAGFDIVVILQSLAEPGVAPNAIVAESARVARDGGRIVVIQGGTSASLFGMMKRQLPGLGGESVRELLTAAGLRAARVLAEAEGATYVEASKPRQA